ncbi:MAG TPA: RING finger protein [Planctomycetota bacterium]|nr:RING finger protein [Planctomycetota bacterium]
MTPEEALDLLPLLVADELDPATRDEVQAALAGRDVDRELAAWEELDGLLERGLAPEPAAVSVRCPFCHDAVKGEDRVLCAACLTPHHRACYAEHDGCSLLGCPGKAVARVSSAQVVCRSCRGDVPEGAPYCPWCRSRVVPRRPRRMGPIIKEAAVVAASLLLLLPGAAAIGYFSERELERAWWQSHGSKDALAEEAEARRVLALVVDAQKAYRAEGAKGGEYAADLDALLPILDGRGEWRKAKQDHWIVATEASLSRPDERFFATVTRHGHGVFENQEERVSHVEPGVSVDRVLCRLVPGRGPDAHEVLVRALADVRQRFAGELDRSAERARRQEELENRLRLRMERLDAPSLARRDK